MIVSCPDVSFVITGYDAKATLRRAVVSALSQLNVHHEVIYVDDGSTDGSVDLIETIQDPRLICISLGRVGRARALNAGIETARATRIAVLDSDDVALPIRALTQLAFLDAHPNCEVVGGQLEVVDPAGRPDRSRRMRFPVLPEEIDGWIHRGRMPLAHPAMMFRRNWFERVGGYDASVLRAEDFDIVLRGWAPLRYAALPDVVTRYTAELFPSWKYWRRELQYTRAVHRRWRRNETGPLDLRAEAKPIDKVADGVKWGGQLCRHWIVNRERVTIK